MPLQSLQSGRQAHQSIKKQLQFNPHHSDSKSIRKEEKSVQVGEIGGAWAIGRERWLRQILKDGKEDLSKVGEDNWN